MQQVYLVLWAFLSAFVIYREHYVLLLTCYEYEHRQKSLGNEVCCVRTTPSPLLSGHPLAYSTGGGRQLLGLCDTRNCNTYLCPW